MEKSILTERNHAPTCKIKNCTMQILYSNDFVGMFAPLFAPFPWVNYALKLFLHIIFSNSPLCLEPT